MNTNNNQEDTSEKVNNAISKLNEARLLSFDENNKVSTGRDINVKITALDSDMTQLRAELSIINSSVEEGMDRLGDTDTDLTAKVSETYKRLGEIDNAYKSLLSISSRIDADLQKLNGDISDVAVQSATGIKSLEQSTVTQSHELAQKSHQVASRVNQLVETSKLTNEMMDKNIQSTTEKMLLIEKNVVTQIENLSTTSKDKADAIADNVEQNKAKILKLQSVDEAIIRRATTLEITTAELSAKGQYIDSSVEQLQISSDALSASATELCERVAALDALTSRHGSIIEGLQKGSADLAARLKTLAGREQKHFNFALIGLLLLLVASAVIFITQQSRFASNDLMFVEQGETFGKQNAGLQQSQAALEEKIERVAFQLNDVQDQAASISGRINQSPFIEQIGNDNIIHGPQWISSLSPEEFTVQLAYADNKDALYEIAQDYNFYLQDSLSYFVTNENGAEKYVLLSGNYASRQQAVSAVKSLPAYIDWQQPVVREIAAVQKYIAAL
jgi:chromosome segregation ATPase